MAESKQSMGGKARALKLGEGERSDIARLAATARWAREGKQMIRATHEGELNIGNAVIPCAVLEDRRRVLTQSGFMVALGRARQAKGRAYYNGDVNLPAFLTAKNLKPFIPPELSVTSSQIEFQALKGNRAFGYAAELLPMVCGVFLDAKDVLTHNQEHIADQALILIRGLASTGIIALVDEATGYQYDRPRHDLEEYLKEFLSEELRRWVRTFPADFIKHLCRLRNVEVHSDMKLPQYFGKLTDNLVYRRMAPGLVGKLKERRLERGKASNKLFQWLSEDIGLRGLLVHLGTVIGLMKIHTNYDAFVKQLDTVAHIYPDTPGLFDNPADWEEPK